MLGQRVFFLLAFWAKRGFCDPECWDACPGSVYTGSLSETVNGQTCEAWSEYSEFNYCRDPQGIGQPGCYTTDPEIPYELCEVPICDYKCCYENKNLKQFTGTTSETYTGSHCLAWADQTFPYNFNNDSLFPADGSVELAGNYCRDPDNSEVLWCYVEDDDNKHGRSRQKCAIPKCHPYSIYCGGVLEVGQGWISPIFLDSGRWLVCRWTLITDEGYRITVLTNSINLRPPYQGKCLLNRIGIYDGIDHSRKLILQMCGGETIDYNITSVSNKMTIQFKGVDRASITTDGTISFNISYSRTKGPAYCDELHTGTTGSLASPDSNLDGIYDLNLDCWYTLVAPAGLVVQLAVLDIDLVTYVEITDSGTYYCLDSSDTLKIYASGEDGEFTSYIGQFCTLEPPPVITTRYNKLRLNFNTGQWLSTDGFFALYSATVNRTEYFDGILNDMSGLVAVSSNYQLRSVWTITAPNHFVLHLFIITTEPGAHECEQAPWLQVFDGATYRSSVLETICGSIPPATIEATNQALTLVFRYSYIPDDEILRPPFVAWYRTFPRQNTTLRHSWPRGEYSIPMTVYGCNSPQDNQWSTAYINITFKHRVLVTKHKGGHIDMKSPSLLIGPYGDRSFQMNFCVRESESTEHDNKPDGWWPPGHYMVYGTESGCPSDLIPVNVSRTIPEIRHVNTDGRIPYIAFHSLESKSRIDLILCYKSSDVNEVNTEFNSIFPFAVLSANQMPEKQNNVDFTNENITFISNETGGEDTEYPWFTFVIYLPERISKQYKPWEFWRPDEQFLHELSAKDYPPYGSDWTNNGDDRLPEWLLYDLGQSMSINALRFVKWNGRSYINGMFTAVPEIMISEWKWSFLYNGASLCLRSIYRLKHMIEVMCLNGQPASSGRYITFLLRSPLHVNILQRIKNSWKIQINRAEKSERCNQFLGMTDESITDFQISSPSSRTNFPPANARPYKRGWCASQHDYKPTIQVDLAYPTQVEGVNVYNWWHSESNLMFGVYEFAVDIGLDKQLFNLSAKTKVFKVDLSQPSGTAQTFMFVTPIMGQYIRISPLTGVPGSDYKCLKFELIGCLYKERISDRCGTKDNYTWVETPTLYVSAYSAQVHTIQKSSSALSCIQHCEDHHKYCTAIVYDETNDQCLWYEESQMENYKRIDLPPSQRGLFKTCSPDTRTNTTTASLYMFKEDLWERSITVIDIGDIVVSLGYSQYYLRGYVCVWRIASHDVDRANVVFTDLDFNVYETQANISNDLRSFSDKIDTIFISTIRFDGTIFYTNNRILDTGIDFLDYSSNGKVSFKRQTVQFLFRSWQTDAKILHQGRGFRARIFMTDEIFCKPPTTCFKTPGYIGSESFLGDFSPFDVTKWAIQPSFDTVYIELVFNEFDIGCDTGSYFQIAYLAENVDVYCNLNKPFGRVRSLGNRVEITFHPNVQPNSMLEGFSATFSEVTFKYIDRTEFRDTDVDLARHLRNITLYGNTYSVQDYYYGGRCSDHFQKCYFLFDFEWINWLDLKSDVCESVGMSLLSIQSWKEMDLVGGYVAYELRKAYTNSVKPGEIRVPIGLRRHRLKSGKYKYEWIDRKNGNRPVTFTSWAESEPVTTTGYDCGILAISQTKYAWRLVKCDEPLYAVTGVCEGNFYPKSNSTFSDFDNDTTVPVSSVFRDSAVYFLCDNNEVISVLGRCDGNEDCADQSDEAGCDVKTSEGCGGTEFRCGDGTCVQISLLCDHFKDCSDASDEQCDFVPCTEDQYRCQNGACIPREQRCDDKRDCYDNSDEQDCEEAICGNWRSLRCEGRCIANSSICNGVTDCLDGVDETDCPMPSSCPEWYHAGYTESGAYNIGGFTVECDFSGTDSSDSVITRYHYIDYERRFEMDRSHLLDVKHVIYKDENIVEKLAKLNQVQMLQFVEQKCTPARQLIHDLDSPHDKDPTHVCQCKLYLAYTSVVSGEQRKSKNYCTGKTVNINELIEDIAFAVDVGLLTGQYNQITGLYIYKRSLFLNEGLRLKLSPLEVLTYPDGLTPTNIPCGFALSADYSLRCFYDWDEYGNLRGCQSMAHLQNCESFICPSGYFKCRNSFCLESRFLCDGETQCLTGEDERGCDTRTCRGQYRCLNSTVCLSVNHLCDGFRQCPSGDDERFCEVRYRCPETCDCYGAMVHCKPGRRTAQETRLTIPEAVRLIDLHSNPGFYHGVAWNTHEFRSLIHLNLSQCEIDTLSNRIFRSMSNLRVLDLSGNAISSIPSFVFASQRHLVELRLLGNSHVLSIEERGFTGLSSAFKHLYLSDLQIGRIQPNAFSSLKLQVLDLSSSTIQSFEHHAFQDLDVKKLYLNGTGIILFSKDIFKGITNIGFQFSDAYKFCCIAPTYLPEENCFPQKTLFSSCSDVIGNDVMRPLLWLIALIGLLANGSSFIYNMRFDKVHFERGYPIFVTNLNSSDFIMGVSMLIIVSGDAAFRGSYIFTDDTWRSGFLCTCARVLSTLSCQSSMVFLGIIAFDRILVIKYPDGQIHLTRKSALLIVGVIWSLNTVSALAPFLPFGGPGKPVASPTSVCLSTIMSTYSSGPYFLSVAVFMTGFLMTSTLVVYGAVISQHEMTSLRRALSGKVVSRTDDLKISRNLLLLELLNMIVWFPVVVLGMMDKSGIHSDFYEWTALVIFPLNSALCPLLYTLTIVVKPKVFKPDREEQKRQKFYTKDMLDKVLGIWQDHHFLKRRTFSPKFKSLDEVLENKRLTPRDCVKIIIGVTRCLQALHDRNISQNELTEADIYLRRRVDGSRAVFLVCRHRFASESSAKSSNIRELGFIIRDIIKRSQLVNFDVLMSGKKKVSKKNKSIISNLSVKLFRHQTQ